MRMLRAAFMATILAAGPALAADEPRADVTVRGKITASDAQHYLPIDFDVPAGVERVTVTLDYDKTNKTVVDMGVWGPDGFRGWSGGTRDRFTIARSDASPGYLPGPLTPGRWHVMLGVPNARADAHSAYTVRVFFDTATARHASDAIALPPLKTEPGWYRGDLHMHNANSDGSCLSLSGTRVPCPLFRTVEAAAKAGLDFIAITDHNTVAQFDNERELQAYFDTLLLIPGTEVTTFHGHANAIGIRHFVDFRVGTPAVSDARTLEHEVKDAGGILSINHPNLPSGELCMGCGWTWPDTDYAGITAIEAINANTLAAPLVGTGFWYARLNEGHHLTGIGGSDNHDVDAPDGKAPVGTPTTVVHASALSLPAILDGIRAGNVFIDVEGTRDRMLEMTGRSGGKSAAMGETLPGGRALTLKIHVAAAAGATLVPIANGQPIKGRALPITDPDQRSTISLDKICGWVSVNVERDAAHPLLIGNPIYLACRL